MPRENLIPIQLNVTATSDPSLTVDSDNNVDIYIGEGVEFDATLVNGGPPVTEAQWRNSELQLYEDAERQNRLGSSDEGNITHEFFDIDVSAGTAKLRLTVASGVTARSLYAYLRVEQGA